MGSVYLSSLNAEQKIELRKKLFQIQQGACFICQKAVHPELHADAIDIDHIEPLNSGGRDDQSNFALTHSNCNRSKQDSDLRVARVLKLYDSICEHVAPKDTNLGHVLSQYGGALYDLPIVNNNGSIEISLTDINQNETVTSPLLIDRLSGFRSFHAEIPIAYLHHDDQINPRPIGRQLRGLILEFFRGNPQLHVGLGWLDLPTGENSSRAKIRIFDGQHKIAAQVLLGVKALPIRIFVNPDRDRLLNANTNAGTTLRQIAFDKSVQRRLGGTILLNRIDRFRADNARLTDDWSFSERDLVRHFRGEARAVQRYVLDNIRNSITHHEENRLRDFIEFSGKGKEKPFSYSSIEKTFYSFFINQEMLETAWDFRADTGENKREIEKQQIIRLMNMIADLIYVGLFDTERGTDRIESAVQNGEDIPDDHLCAYRMAKEEILYCWLKYVRSVAQQYFIMQGQPIADDKLFQTLFPEALWSNIKNFIINLRKLPLWKDHEMSITVFGGKANYSFWESIFSTGSSPQGQRVLAEPINLIAMIQS